MATAYISINSGRLRPPPDYYRLQHIGADPKDGDRMGIVYPVIVKDPKDLPERERAETRGIFRKSEGADDERAASGEGLLYQNFKVVKVTANRISRGEPDSFSGPGRI
jgi:hypothetical protein